MSAYRPDVHEMAHAIACPRCGVAVVVADADDTLRCGRCDAQFVIPPGTARTALATVPRARASVPSPATPPAVWSLQRGTGGAEKALLGVVGGTVCMMIAMALELDGLLVALALFAPLFAGMVAAERHDRRRVLGDGRSRDD